MYLLFWVVYIFFYPKLTNWFSLKFPFSKVFLGCGYKFNKKIIQIIQQIFDDALFVY